MKLQQYLPFTVLKRLLYLPSSSKYTGVATVLTVYGIETLIRKLWTSFSPAVATVLTVYGIETARAKRLNCLRSSVATVLTVYGIETFFWTLLAGANFCCNSTYRLRY